MNPSTKLHFRPDPALPPPRSVKTTAGFKLPPMRVCAALLGLAVATLPAEPVKFDSIKTTDGKTYQKVEVVSQDAIGIKIKHEGGIARLGFDKLPEELQTRFGYDPAKAVAQQTEEIRQERQQQQQLNQELLRQQQEQRKQKPQPKTPAPGTPDSVPSGNDEAPTTGFDLDTPPDEAVLPKLGAYIISMKAKMESAQQEVTALQAKATMEGMKMKTVRQIDSRGNETVYSIPDKSAQFRAKSLARKAGELTKKIEQARQFVTAAEAKYARLAATPQPAAPPSGQRP
jgi:hypothetical protein